MPVNFKPIDRKDVAAALAQPGVKALVTLRKCENDCGHLHAKLTRDPDLTTEELGHEIHRAAWRTLNPDLPDPVGLITVSIAHVAGLPIEPDGTPNAAVTITGDTDAMTPQDIITGLEILVERMRERHGAATREHPDANGAYL